MHQPEPPSEPKSISLCIVSDCMAHITCTFYAFQKAVIQCIKTLDSNVRNMSTSVTECFRKNRNGFASLVHHKNDLELLQSGISLSPVMVKALVML
jgi:hypothetical protein